MDNNDNKQGISAAATDDGNVLLGVRDENGEAIIAITPDQLSDLVLNLFQLYRDITSESRAPIPLATGSNDDG